MSTTHLGFPFPGKEIPRDNIVWLSGGLDTGFHQTQVVCLALKTLKHPLRLDRQTTQRDSEWDKMQEAALS